MPPRTYKKKKMRKKRTGKGATVIRKRAMVPRPQVYAFKRTRQYMLNLGVPDSGWTTTVDNCVVKTYSFALGELDNYTEFVNLFAQYKLNYAVIKLFPNRQITGNVQTTANGGGCLVTIWRNTHGNQIQPSFTIADLNQIQSKQQFMMPARRPAVIKMPLRQISETFGSSVNTDYATVKPRYVSTQEPGTAHYGVNVHIQSIDQLPFVNSATNMILVQQDLLLTCKQVK